MTSIYEKLENLTREYKNTTDKIIALNIINTMRQKKILTQKQLADICFVSESKITKFIQSLGEPNFKTFASSLKKEHFLYDSINKTNFKSDILALIKMWCNKNSVFIKNLATAIKNNININIYASAQTSWIAQGIRDLLISYNKRPLILSKNFDIFNEPLVNNEDINIVLFYGRDNFTLNSYLKLINDKTIKANNFVITSEKQYEKVFLESDNKLKLDYLKNNASNVYRNLALNILILEIAKLI